MPKTMLTNGSMEGVAARMPNLEGGDMHDVLKRSQDLSECYVSKGSTRPAAEAKISRVEGPAGMYIISS